MHTLHIITPSHATTSCELIGLLRLSMLHIGGEHRVIVIGNHNDVVHLRSMGVDVLGSIDGANNASKTLTTRLHKLINRVFEETKLQIISWGWHSTSVVSSLRFNSSILGIVDEIDLSCSMSSCKMKVIPTNWNCSKHLRELGVLQSSITEPLVGVNPNVLTVDKKSSRELLKINQNSFVVSIVGSQSSWQEVLSMIFRLKNVNKQIDFVIPESYKYRSQLLLATKTYSLLDIVHDIHTSLRTMDVVRASDCVWVPDISSYDASYGVLDVISVACEDVPLAVGVNHSVSSIPTVGQQIAWARDELDASSWILDLVNGSKNTLSESKNQFMNVRSYVTPTRFIDGFLMRM